MKRRHRIVQLASGRYAIEYRGLFGGWHFVCVHHPDISWLVRTFDSVEEARQYFKDPMEVIAVIEEVCQE